MTIAAGAAAMWGAATSADAADFYAGKTVTFMINYQAGGPADLEGRIIAHHLAKHIAGAPTIIVKNMGGAGGAVGANWLGQVAAPDGLTIGHLTGIASKAATGEPSVKIDLTSLAFVATGVGTSVAYARTDIPPGLKTPIDLMKAKNFWAGGLTADSGKDLQLRLQFDLLGLPYRYVTGYAGTAEARLAFDRGEIQAYSESLPTYRALIEPTFVKTGKALPIWYDSTEEDPSKRNPDTIGIQASAFPQFYEQARGKKPSGEMWEALETVGEMSSTYLRVVAMAPGTPKEAVDDVKKAFVDLAKDPEFRAEATTTMKFVPNYVVDARVEKQFKEKLHMDPSLQRFIKAYIEKGKQMTGK
jgi:tripartite-type tricarboxylate transporter receptor subunit TctC